MPWQSLSKRIGTLKAQVLAGPMLRKVDETSVTVWLALRNPCTVTIKILDPQGTVSLSGSRHTIQIGPLLHIVAVTAEQPLPRPSTVKLVENVIYRYDLSFAFDDGTRMDLRQATDSALLTYGTFDRPSFCLPPSDLTDLRLMNGSCRKPHGYGPDTLPILDQLLFQTAAVPSERPHQLLLMGDQIYADDVAAVLLLMLTDAADVLLGTSVPGRNPGWQELLPCPPSNVVPTLPNPFPVPGGLLPATGLPPYWRKPHLLRIGFSSVDLDSHLMSLGEYICMYLFVWSDVLWPTMAQPAGPVFELPEFDHVLGALRVNAPFFVGSEWANYLRSKKAGITNERERVMRFAETLSAVRRVLANTPTYTIFDDHEVTDDWNMTRDICEGQYGSPLGLRIVQNALAAYAVCQHWGNCPEQFADGSTTLPGSRLLRMLNGTGASSYQADGPDIQTCVGVHDLKTLREHAGSGTFGVYHDANSLTYNYTIVGPAHQIIMTDSRSWRVFPRGGGGAPDLMPASQIAAQIAQAPDPESRALVVVVSTNAPPVQFIRSSTRHPRLANTVQHFPDIFESWEIATVATDRLYRAITDKLPLVAGRRQGGALLLSGDVHSGFASRLLFTGTARFEDPVGSGQPVAAVLAQLVASALRNQNSHTIDQHGDGYNYAPTGMGVIVPDYAPEGYAGWNRTPGSGVRVGTILHLSASGVSGTPLKLDQPTVPVMQNGLKIRTLVDPDYGYRLDYLRANTEATHQSNFGEVPPIPPGATAAQRQAAAAAFRVATGNYREYNKSRDVERQVVGYNNIGEVTFNVAAGSRRVNHTLRWYHPARPNHFEITNYSVSLDPNDQAFKYSDVAPTKVS